MIGFYYYLLNINQFIDNIFARLFNEANPGKPRNTTLNLIQTSRRFFPEQLSLFLLTRSVLYVYTLLLFRFFLNTSIQTISNFYYVCIYIYLATKVPCMLAFYCFYINWNQPHLIVFIHSFVFYTHTYFIAALSIYVVCIHIVYCSSS